MGDYLTYTIPITCGNSGFKLVYPFCYISRENIGYIGFLKHFTDISGATAAAVLLLLDKVDLVESRKGSFQFFCGLVGFIEGLSVILLDISGFCESALPS